MNPRSLVRMVAATLAGALIGLVVGYIPSLVVYFVVAGATQNTSQTGGWAEAGSVGGVVWLGSAGLVVGFVQQRALPPSARSFWWILALAAVWAGAHVVNMAVRGLAGDVNLSELLPALLVASLAVGIATLGLAGRAPASS